VEALFSIQGHPTTEAFEEYAFKRLSEPDTEALEEHLLVCPECQTSLSEVDEYILLMKQATAGLERCLGPDVDPRVEPPPETRREPQSAPARPRAGALIAASVLRRGPLLKRSLAYAIFVIGAGASIFFATASRPLAWASRSTPEPGPATVELLALRGGEPVANHAQSGRPLDLIIDLTGIEDLTGKGSIGVTSDSTGDAPKYRIEIVDAVGKSVWNGETARSQGSLSAHLTHLTGCLRPGQYWVRLYSRGTLLREFGLRAD
jgi:hypothetical protein